MTQLPLLAARSQRLAQDSVSFRTRMLEIAAGLPDLIALGRGDPSFNTPQHIVEAAKGAIDTGQHHYTHAAGLPQLREAIAATLWADNKLSYEPEEIIVTSGAQEAMILAMLGLVNEGDEVLLSSPGYSSYDIGVRLCAGVRVPVRTHERDDFALTPAEIEQCITEQTKVLVLVTPNNPTGAVTPSAVIREIADLAVRHDLIVISDEIYSKLVFDGFEHLSIASLPHMKERSITISGFSKAYAMTGWRVGYLAGPQPFVRALLELRHALSISTNTPAQYAALAALTGRQDAVEEMRQAYAERAVLTMKALDQMGLTYGRPGGSFFLYANVSNAGLPAPQFCQALLTEEHVLVYPGTMFGDDSGHYIRISLIEPPDRLMEAMARMERFIAKCRARMQRG
jgi:aminotransferase